MTFFHIVYIKLNDVFYFRYMIKKKSKLMEIEKNLKEIYNEFNEFQSKYWVVDDVYESVEFVERKFFFCLDKATKKKL